MRASALVEMRDVAVGYGEQPILSNVEFRLEAGEIVSVIGISGSGKSTLLRATAGLLPPMAGTVRVFGEELYELPGKTRGRLLSRLGLLFQDGALFGSMSVIDNVMFPGRKLTRLPDEVLHELALIKLAQVGVAELAERMPHDLSGGETKRVALARANLLNPRLLLCDEPTSGLDPFNATVLGRLLRHARDDGDTAIMLVTHDMQMVRELSDRAIVVAAGGIRAEGPPTILDRSEDPHVRELFHQRA
jgi:phospholipid/cholesterol/gamma-HCH transport system ATP-binding protein